jgi:hypothetical protein
MVAKLGNFLVDIDTQVNERGVNSLNKSLGGLATKSAKVGSVLLGATTLAGGGFLKLVKNTVESTAELGRLSDDLGVSTTFLETFIRSFETVGAGAGEAINTIRSLKKEIEAFKLGKGNIEAFGILGINPQALSGDISKNFDVIRKRFRSLTDEQRLYFVDQIGLGEKTLRVLRLSDDEYAKIQRRSKEISTLTKKQNKEAEAFAKQIKFAEQSYAAFKRDLILEISPAFAEFSKEMVKLFNDPSFRESIKSAIEGLLQVLPKLVAILPDLTNALVKLANFITPDIIEDQDYKKRPVEARAGARILDFLSGGFLTGEKFKDRMSFAEAEKQKRIKNLRRSRGIEEAGSAENYLLQTKRVRPSTSSSQQVINGGNNTYNITVPVQRIGQDVTEEDRLAIKIADELDRRNDEAAENLKSGAIQ